MKKEIFKNFDLAMFRQWFGEEKKDKVYTAGEIWEMLNQASPLFPNNDTKLNSLLNITKLDYCVLCKADKPYQNICKNKNG